MPKINIPERQNLSPGGSVRTPPRDPALDSGTYDALAKVGREVGNITATLADAKARSTRDALVTERVAQAHTESAVFLDERAKNPDGHETLLKDAETFQKELRTRLTSGLDSRTRQQLELHLQPILASEGIKARHLSTQQLVDSNRAKLDTSLDDLTLAASRAGSPSEMMGIIDFGKQSIEAQRQSGVLSAEQAAKRQDAFRDQIYVNQIEKDLLDSPGSVLALLKDQENYRDLRPDLRTRYLARAKHAIEAKRAESLEALRFEVRDADYALDRGYVPPGLDKLAAKVKGTKLEREFSLSVGQAGEVAKFALLPPVVQDEMIGQITANRSRSGQEVRLIERLEKVRDRQRQDFKSDPIQLGIELGLEQPLAPLDLGNRERAIEGFGQRARAALRLEAHFGRPVAPLQAREAEQISRILREGDVATRLTILGTMNEGLGSRATVAMSQIADKGQRQLAYAGAVMRDDGEAARLLLTGIKQREANKNLVPKDTDFLSNKYISRAMEALQDVPEARADVLEAARNIYAGLAAEAGKFDGILDGDLAELAIERATGGVIEWDAGIGVSGSFVLAPKRGVTEKDFSMWIEKLGEQDIERMGGVAGLKPDDALTQIKKKSRLKSVGPGRYLVQIGNGYLVRKDGEPFELVWGEP